MISKTARAALLLAGVLAAGPAWAADLPPPPARWVTDGAGFLSEAARARLDARLEAYQQQSGHHVLVWIGRSTGTVPIEDFTVRAFAAWKVGRQGLDDGVVLFVFADDRKLRLEVGYGLEGPLPDAIASRIVAETIVPRIQAGDRDGALESGAEAVLAAIEGRPPPAAPERLAPAAPRQRPVPKLSAAEKIVVGIVVVGFLILLVTNPALALHLIFSILSSGGRGGYSGGSGGYSGGGGRSGGGGATGSW